MRRGESRTRTDVKCALRDIQPVMAGHVPAISLREHFAPLIGIIGTWCCAPAR